MKIRVLQVPELLANGFNLITAVGQCAVVPPRIIAIEYDNTAAAEGALKNQVRPLFMLYLNNRR